MQRQEMIANPFALMMDPEGVVQEMERSERLNRLHRRICRPLDKPLIPKVGEDGSFDAQVEAEYEQLASFGSETIDNAN